MKTPLIILATFTAVMLCLALGVSVAGRARKPVVPVRQFVDTTYARMRKEWKAPPPAHLPGDSSARTDMLFRAKRDSFAATYTGKWVAWTGSVADVVREGRGYLCKIEMDRGELFSVADIECAVDERAAMTLRRGQSACFTGRISRVWGDLGLRISLDDATVRPL